MNGPGKSEKARHLSGTGWSPREFLRSLRMRDALALAALPMLALVWIFGAAVLDYRQVTAYDDWWSREARIRKFLSHRLQVVDLFQAQRLERRLDAEAEDPRLLRLRVDPGPWNAWQREPLALKDQWLDAGIQRGPTLLPAEIKKRGDTSVHWTTPKRSFTLKTPRGSLYKSYRRLAYSSKDVLPQVITARLAADFDLLAPEATVAPVFLNDRFYGMYRVMEPLDESFLRRRQRMPGNLFRGDTAERGEYFKGVPRGLFGNPAIWDRTAASNKPGDRPRETLGAFLADLNRDDFEGHLALMDWLDRDEVARLVAVMLLVGDPYHMDDIHNQFWYFDPSSGRMHPVPWDLRLWDLEVNERKRPLPLNRFLEEATRNPWLVDTMWRTLHDRIGSGELRERVRRELEELHAPYVDHFRYDRLRGDTIAEVGSPEEVLATLDANLARIAEWMEDTRFVAHLQPDERVSVLDIESRGFAGADLHAIEVDRAPASAASHDRSELRLRADRNRNGVLDADDPSLAVRVSATGRGLRLELDRPEPLLAALDSEALSIRPAALHYRFFLEHRSATDRSAVALDLRHRQTGRPVPVVGEWQVGEPVSPTPSWHPWQYPDLPSGTRQLSGQVRLSETLTVERGQTLRIAPGTTLRMEPGVSLLIRGRLVAEGTEREPIRVEPADPGRPWGALVLQGDGADGSRLDWITVTGGSGARLERVLYSGMVSVHWARDVRFRHVTLADNVGCDDTFNAVHAEVDLLESTIHRANSDAIDFDYSEGRIEGCRIEQPANDAIDLMTSNPRIVGNTIVGAGDKAISIGEASRPLVFGNRILGGNRGLEIKDLSEPWIVHNTITGNRIGILQTVKNWRYGGGGRGKLVRSEVHGNERDLVQDTASRLTVAESRIGDRDVGGDGGDLSWVYQQIGLSPRATAPGVQPVGGRTVPLRPADERRYADDLKSVSGGWRATGGISRLDKRDQALFVSFGRGQGEATLDVDWDLSRIDAEAWAVFEVRAENVTDASVTVIDVTGGRHRVDLKPVAAGVTDFALATVSLPRGSYDRLVIGAAPESWNEASRIQLRSLRLIAPPVGKDEPR